MGTEIERKFLVKGNEWRHLGEGSDYRQGYLNSVKERTVRIRTVRDRGFLTIKGQSRGLTRQEFEYDIPFSDALALLDLCEKPLIEKKRYTISLKNLIWEVDEFFGVNQGLILAEVELETEDQIIEKPSWIGEEVSHDPRYFNANLIHFPFSQW